MSVGLLIYNVKVFYVCLSQGLVNREGLKTLKMIIFRIISLRSEA